MNPIEERRLGRFQISREVMYGTTYEVMMQIMNNCFIVKAEELGYMDAFEYIAYHPDFEPVPLGTMPPYYIAEMHSEYIEEEDLRITTFQRWVKTSGSYELSF